MDIIAEWLSAARASGTVFSRSELSEPWGFRYPAAPVIAFHLLPRGRAYLRLEGQATLIPLGQGDIVVLGSGRGHSLLSSPGARSENILGHLARHPLGPDRTIRHGGGGTPAEMICGAYTLEEANAGSLLSLLPPVIHLAAELSTNGPAQATLQLLLHEMRLTSRAGDAVLSRLLDVLLIYVLRAWAATAAAGGTRGWLTALNDPAVASSLVRMHEKPARNWTVDSLAAEAGMSRSAFARRFGAQVGEAPLSYLTRWRMTLAARLLQDSGLPISAVAAKVGYGSEFAFNRAFARVRGMAPGRWRNETRKADAMAQGH